MQQPLKEALGRGRIPAVLHENVQHHPVLIDGPQEVMQCATDAQEHLVEVPGVTWPRPPPLQPRREVPAELETPPPDALVRDRDAALGRAILTIGYQRDIAP
jgi:hypothetical protein